MIEALRREFNPAQYDAVHEAATGHDRISLIQGPPGTGKTRCLGGLVSCLLLAAAKTAAMPRPYLSHYDPHGANHPLPDVGGPVLRHPNSVNPHTHPNPARTTTTTTYGDRRRVLLCAQSNAAIDEAICRVQLGGLFTADGQRREPKIVRLGRPDSVTIPSVKDVLLETLAGPSASGSTNWLQASPLPGDDVASLGPAGAGGGGSRPSAAVPLTRGGRSSSSSSSSSSLSSSMHMMSATSTTNVTLKALLAKDGRARWAWQRLGEIRERQRRVHADCREARRMVEVAERNWDEWLRRNQYHMHHHHHHHHPGPRPHDNDPAVLERTLSERRAKLREREDEAKQDEKEVERLMKVLDRVAKYLRDVTLYEADVVVCTLSTAGGELSSLLDALDLNPEGLEGVGELHHPDDPLRPPPDGSLSDNATRHGKIDTNQHSTHEPTPRRTCSRRTNLTL